MSFIIWMYFYYIFKQISLMVSFVIVGEWQTLIFISSCPFEGEGSVFLFHFKATPLLHHTDTALTKQKAEQISEQEV